MSTFPAAPDDPFAAALGARPPTSPFRPGDGASPPHLAGRKRLLATAADRIRACHEQRPMPPLGFHGPSGIGKTALLDQVQAEIIARGGVVARLSGHSPQTALSTLAAAHDRLTGTDQSAADVPAGDVAAVFVAAAQTAANDDRVFMVLVDDMHAGSALTEDLGAAYDAVSARGAGAGLIVAGVHDHGRLDRMPHGIQSLEVSYLQPDEAHDAIATPLRHHDIDVDPDLVQAAANRSGGLPLHVQAWGDELWLAAHDPNRPTDLGALAHRVDQRLGQYYSLAWRDLTDSDRAYVAAIANEFGGPVAAGTAAEDAGYNRTQSVSPLRAKLLDQGILHVPEFGHIEVAIAGFGRWHTRHTGSGLAAVDQDVPRTAATHKQYGLAADGAAEYGPSKSR